MSVFDTPRTDDDVLPPHLDYRFGEDWSCSRRIVEAFGGCIGEGLRDQSRLLLDDLGTRKAKLWAWPTETGGVCWAWDEGPGGCQIDWSFRAGKRFTGAFAVGFMGIDPDELRVGAPGVLVGIVPDTVARVDLIVAGVSVRARLGRNGVFYELPSTRCVPNDIEEVRITFADGTVDRGPTGWSSPERQEPGVCWS